MLQSEPPITAQHLSLAAAQDAGPIRETERDGGGGALLQGEWLNNSSLREKGGREAGESGEKQNVSGFPADESLKCPFDAGDRIQSEFSSPAGIQSSHHHFYTVSSHVDSSEDATLQSSSMMLIKPSWSHLKFKGLTGFTWRKHHMLLFSLQDGATCPGTTEQPCY